MVVGIGTLLFLRRDALSIFETVERVAQPGEAVGTGRVRLLVAADVLKPWQETH
jgi:hypothetical protein